MGKILQLFEAQNRGAGTDPHENCLEDPEQNGLVPQVQKATLWCYDTDLRYLFEPLLFSVNGRIQAGDYTLVDAMQFCHSLLTIPNHTFEAALDYLQDPPHDEIREERQTLTCLVVRANGSSEENAASEESGIVACFEFQASGHPPPRYGATLFSHSPNR